MTFAELKQRADLYEKLMRLDKPIGTLLLLWPTLCALWIATGGRPHWLLVWIFALGTLLMRSAGCVINDYADRDFDPHVERTKDRPLAARTVSTREALTLAAVLVFCSFLLVLPIIRQVWWLALIAVFLAASYPITSGRDALAIDAFINSTARSPASISTPASLYVLMTFHGFSNFQAHLSF